MAPKWKTRRNRFFRRNLRNENTAGASTGPIAQGELKTNEEEEIPLEPPPGPYQPDRTKLDDRRDCAPQEPKEFLQSLSTKTSTAVRDQTWQSFIYSDVRERKQVLYRATDDNEGLCRYVPTINYSAQPVTDDVDALLAKTRALRRCDLASYAECLSDISEKLVFEFDDPDFLYHFADSWNAAMRYALPDTKKDPLIRISLFADPDRFGEMGVVKRGMTLRMDGSGSPRAHGQTEQAEIHVENYLGLNKFELGANVIVTFCQPWFDLWGVNAVFERFGKKAKAEKKTYSFLVESQTGGAWEKFPQGPALRESCLRAVYGMSSVVVATNYDEREDFADLGFRGYFMQHQAAEGGGGRVVIEETPTREFEAAGT